MVESERALIKCTLASVPDLMYQYLINLETQPECLPAVSFQPKDWSGTYLAQGQTCAERQ